MKLIMYKFRSAVLNPKKVRDDVRMALFFENQKKHLFFTILKKILTIPGRNSLFFGYELLSMSSYSGINFSGFFQIHKKLDMDPGEGARFVLPGQYIFQQDNDRKHTSNLLTEWFPEARIKVLPWHSS